MTNAGGDDERHRRLAGPGSPPVTDAAHPARAIDHGQREWFMERFLEWTKRQE
jgi:hypothetical protein